MDAPPRTPPYPAALAAQKFDRVYHKPLIRQLLRLFREKPDETLLSFEQVQQLIRDRAEIDRGTQLIELSRIIGSVGRYRDFDRAFLPLSGADAERWKRLDVAMNELRDLPPIDVYQIGDVYFVRDGNHRVSVAKANGLDAIEARVTEVPTLVPLTPETDVDDLIIKIEYAQFLRETRLDETRPDQRIELTEPGRYQILLEHIKVHRYYLGLQWGREPDLAEAAASWYDNVYLPVVQAIKEGDVLEEFPQRTEADLYIWVAYHRERLRESYGEMPPDREVAAGLADRFSGKPFGRFVKMISRAVNAALKAAAESPEPPPRVSPPAADELEAGPQD
ncbi:MAG: hypothetical protein MUC34_20240 [Anaerolineae bacterium]|nr:hypothetical protein [Anaerolineae bacterium]